MREVRIQGSGLSEIWIISLQKMLQGDGIEDGV